MRYISHEKYMMAAMDEAKKAYKEREIPIGAVLVKKGEIITQAHNTSEHNHNMTNHAEMIIIDNASKMGIDFSDCKLYTTLEPCGMCAGAIANCGIKEVIFGAFDTEYGCMFSKINLPHIMGQDVKVIGGVCENECKKLIDDFFSEIRNQ